MRKSNSAYLVLALILLVIIVVLCIVLFTGRDRPVSAPTASAVPATPAPPRDMPPGSQPIQETAAPESTERPAQPERTEQPEQTAEPTEPTEPTEEPVLETRPPLETDTAGSPSGVDVGGSFASDTGTYLNLLVRWSAKGSGETVPLQVELCAESYSLYSVASYGNLELTVNGVKYRGDTPVINCEGKDLTVTPLDNFTVDVPRGDVSITAVWYFKGSYSGKELETITASADVYIG